MYNLYKYNPIYELNFVYNYILTMGEISCIIIIVRQRERKTRKVFIKGADNIQVSEITSITKVLKITRPALPAK